MKNIYIGITAPMVLALTVVTPNYARAANLLQYAQLQSKGAQNVENLDMAAVPDLDRDKIRRVQIALRAKGFDPGSANGVVNPRTKAAVEKFQDRFGIKATGAINNQTLFALGVVGETAPTVEEEKKPPPPSSRARRSSKNGNAQRNIEAGARERTRWCAAYQNGSRNCGFQSLDQCRASVSGVGGTCVPD